MLDNYKDLHGNTPEDELTAEQLFERLQGAKLIVQSLQYNMEKNGLDHDKTLAELANLRASVQRQNSMLRDIALDLARCACQTHKGKNEIILAVIARLLAHGNQVYWQEAYPDDGEIPF